MVSGLDSDVVENMLPLRLVGSCRRKVWIKDARAWARSGVNELDNISKRSSIDKVIVLHCCYLHLMTQMRVFMIYYSSTYSHMCRGRLLELTTTTSII